MCLTMWFQTLNWLPGLYFFQWIFLAESGLRRKRKLQLENIFFHQIGRERELAVIIGKGILIDYFKIFLKELLRDIRANDAQSNPLLP